VSRHRINTWDFLLAFAAIVTGMALMFVLLSSSSVSSRFLVGLLGLGTGLTGLSLWRRSRKKESREVAVCKETVLVDSEGSAEILFAPSSPMEDTVLYLSAHGRPVSVEDVWHADVSTVSVPRSVLYWRKGVTYPGTVSADCPLRVLVRNTGYAPAAVRAVLSARKTHKE
jgi:hypothetical protein